jgi:hypothetical protein
VQLQQRGKSTSPNSILLSRAWTPWGLNGGGCPLLQYISMYILTQSHPSSACRAWRMNHRLHEHSGNPLIPCCWRLPGPGQPIRRWLGPLLRKMQARASFDDLFPRIMSCFPRQNPIRGTIHRENMTTKNAGACISLCPRKKA